MTIDAQAAMASDFAGFRCWTPESADQTISIEAVTASPAVFLATHRPLLIARTPVRAEEHAARADLDVVSEADVLKDFSQRRPVNGVLIMPVVGQAGTGKSHLVRWIREHLPEREDRRVVYIEKTNTNLSGVVNALLMDLEGEEFDAIREEVGKVVTDYDERRLPGELLTQLALSIEFSEVDASRPDARYRRGLVGQGRLSALLLDHVMYSRLVAPGGVVARLAKELQHGRARGEAERRFGFEVDDFPMDLAEIESAGASAKKLMQQLVASEELLATAVQLLNENLDQAVLRLANLTGGKLQNAMLDIRRALHRQEQKQEIVLLVEDFAVIQGVQRDLLDAITEVGVREGREELAPIRTLMAVTRGYFDALAETVTTRAAAGIPYLYDLDVSVGEAQSQVSSDHIQDFAARYLNAARLGQATLEETRSKGVGGEGEDWVPNACERCPFQRECHAAFGKSSDGHGLYPFNDQALGRAVRSRLSSNVFNPRAVLGRVLRPVLESYYEDIPNGKFPPPAFARSFPLSPRDRPLIAKVVESLHLNDPVDHDRRVVLLEYWGGAPVEPGNLQEGIHRAFKLPEIDTFEVVVGGGDDDEEEGGSGGALPVRLVRARAALENWFGRNDVLPQEVARHLRGLISSAVLARISWNDLLLAEPTKEELRTVLRDKNATGVRIEGAAGEGGQQESGPASIRIDRNATTATLLGALLTRDHLGHWNFPGGPVQGRRFQSLTDAWGARVVSGVRALRGVDDDATTSSAVAVSLVGALVLGIDGARSRDQTDLMRALLDEGESLATLGDAEVRPRHWNDLASRVLAARPALVKQLRGVGGAAQGGGHVQLIDVDRLLVHVKASGADLDLLNVPDDAPPWLSEAARPLRERLDAAVEAQLSMLKGWADEVRPSFGGASVAPEVLSALEQALEEAVQMGVFTGGRSGMAADQQDLLRRARKYAWSTLDDVRDALSRSEDDKVIRLKEAAADRGRSLGPIQQLATTSHAWLDGTSARAATRLRDEAPEGGLALVEVLSGVERVIQQLQASATGTPAAGTGSHAVPDDDPVTEVSS